MMFDLKVIFSQLCKMRNAHIIKVKIQYKFICEYFRVAMSDDKGVLKNES
jgi:hypothetical protein